MVAVHDRACRAVARQRQFAAQQPANRAAVCRATRQRHAGRARAHHRAQSDQIGRIRYDWKTAVVVDAVLMVFAVF